MGKRILPAIKKYAGLKGVRNTNLAWSPECQWQFAPVDYGWVQSKSGSIQNKALGSIVFSNDSTWGWVLVLFPCDVLLKQPEPNPIALRTKMHKHKKQQKTHTHTHTHTRKKNFYR
jgi:hypothetical protein